jgi:hypothetical protein
MNTTPGPWQAGIYNLDHDGHDHYGVGPVSNDHLIVALTGLVGAADAELSIANAEFIAKAPEMREALLTIQDIAEEASGTCHLADGYFQKILDQVEAVLGIVLPSQTMVLAARPIMHLVPDEVGSILINALGVPSALLLGGYPEPESLVPDPATDACCCLEQVGDNPNCPVHWPQGRIS